MTAGLPGAGAAATLLPRPSASAPFAAIALLWVGLGCLTATGGDDVT